MNRKVKIHNSLENYMVNNRTFIIGSGFSIEAGIPLIGELLAKTMKKFSKECPGIFEKLNDYAKICFKLENDEPDYSTITFSELSNLCTFIEYMEMSEDAGNRWSNAGSREKLALRYYLGETICDLTPSGKEIPEIYLEFAKQLHQGDFVVTFNWDCLIENALKEIGKPYTYKFNNNGINIYKLHGSINWRIGKYKRTSKLNWYPLGYKQGFSQEEVYYNNELLDINVWHDNQPLYEVEPFLVLPGYGKAFDVRKILILWYRPRYIVFYTHDVYIIGLSLSEDDFFIRCLFLEQFPFKNDDDNQPEENIFIINPSTKVESNYSFMLTRNTTKVIPENFSIKHVRMMEKRLIK